MVTILRDGTKNTRKGTVPTIYASYSRIYTVPGTRRVPQAVMPGHHARPTSQGLVRNVAYILLRAPGRTIRVHFRPSVKMALDKLAIPAMSAECERVFSSAKKMVTVERNRLSEDIIQACECLKAWWDNGIME